MTTTTASSAIKNMQARTQIVPLEWLIASGKPVTQEHLDAINNDPHKYENRERIPEPLLVYSDLYHELTGQELLKMDVSSYIEVFQEWKDRALQPNDIRGAWAQSKSDKGGFFVGHPRALTITANGMKSKGMPALPVLNTQRIEQTQKIIEEKVKLESAFVPMPDDVRAQLRAKLAMKGSMK
jgi:hypothetical protein